MARMREVSDRIKALDAAREGGRRAAGGAARSSCRTCPHASVPVGRSADDNVEVRRWGAPRQFAFEPKHALRDRRGARHPRLRAGEQDRQVALHGDVGRGGAARAARSSQLMLDLHTREHGFTEVWVPHLVNAETMVGAAMLPEVRGAAVQDGGAGREPAALPDPDRGGRAHRAARRRDPAEAELPKRLLRVHAVLPPRGGHLRPGHARA